MKVLCPKCRCELRVEDISLDSGWCKCVDCNEVFSLSETLPGFTALPGTKLTDLGAIAKAERPFDSWALVEHSEQQLIVHIPPQGMRADTWALLGFVVFWLGFVAFWTTAALGMFGAVGFQPHNVAFAAFSAPFWIVGFLMLTGVLWSSRGNRTLYVDASQAVTELRCLAYRKRRIIDRSRVQHARPTEIMAAWRNSNMPPRITPGVELIFERGSFQLPCNSEAEQAWLLWEINCYLEDVPYLPPARAPLEETAWIRR